MVRQSIVKRLLVAAMAMSAIWLGHDAGASEAANRVTHYAVVITGPGGYKLLDECNWGAHEIIHEMLNWYGYPDDAIYRLSQYGATQSPKVNGRSTPANVRKVFKHLAGIMDHNDHLAIFLVGHGIMRDVDWIHQIYGDGMRASELKSLLDGLPTKDITISISPCFSGGAIHSLSGPGRVIVTSTTDAEGNAGPWAETFAQALYSQKNRRASIKPQCGGDKAPAPRFPQEGRVSIKQAYDATLDWTIQRYRGKKMLEHPLLDDNGDGVGHFGKAPIVAGDGALAARRFLGNNGLKLVFSPSAIQNLEQLNTKLVLSDLSRIPEVFADESAYLGSLGGYNDQGANSIRREVHLAWAPHQSAPVVVENLVKKYGFQFDRQARPGEASAQRFYAEASARLASHGIDLGDPGRNRREISPHLEWAKRQKLSRLREELEAKVRELMAGASEATHPKMQADKAAEVKALVQAGVNMVEAKGAQATLNAIGDPKGPFIKGDLYLFAGSLDKITLLAHPYKAKELVGKDLSKFKDSKGTQLFVKLQEIAKGPGKGWITYWWPKPGEEKSSLKRAYIMGVPGKNFYIVARYDE